MASALDRVVIQHTSSTPHPTVSVIMIFLNGEEFIEEAIASVYAQTMTSWELLLVDDGSSDRSSHMAKRAAAADPARVRYLTHPNGENRGMSASRNLGIAESQGAYLAFLDCDDVFLPEKLERHVRVLEERHEAAMVFGRTVSWFSWTGRADDEARDFLELLDLPLDRLVRPPELVNAFIELRASTPRTCGVLVRRAAAIRAGGFDERFRGMFEDQVFFYKVCAREPVYLTSDVLDLYRQHQRSACWLAGQGDRDDVFRRPFGPHGVFLDWLERYLAVHCPLDRPRRVALRRLIRPHRHPVRERWIRRYWSARGRAARVYRRFRPRDDGVPRARPDDRAILCAAVRRAPRRRPGFAEPNGVTVKRDAR